MSANGKAVAHVLSSLARLGVREFCVAAGARNAPLVTALLSCQGLRMMNFFDERSAAFFALGRMMADRVPVAVVTTSGTAVAELLPAAMEAHYQGIPLVLVTADRPKRFRGSGAPQAVEQAGILGPYAEVALDLDEGNLDAAAWPARLGLGPLHVNVCLEEGPVVRLDGVDFSSVDATADSNAPDSGTFTDVARICDGKSSVVVTGALHPADAARLKPLLLDLALPIVDEAASNLRADADLRELILPGGEKTLRALEARRVLRFGGVPSWRWWRDLEMQPEIAVANFSVAPFPGLARRENVTTAPLRGVFSKRALQGDTDTPVCSPGHRQESLCHSDAGTSTATQPEAAHSPRASASPSEAAARARAFQASLETILAAHPLSEMAWIRRVSDRIAAPARVMLGNSLPIREWNLAAREPAPGVAFFANRGANGIDGLVSTFLGLSASCEESWLVIGDLSALYDLSAPWSLPRLPPGRRRIVVINNGGGKIFSRVPSLRSLPAGDLEFIENRHTVSFEPWARLWGMSYALCSSASDFPRPEAESGASLIEIRPEPAQTLAFWHEWDALA